MKVIELKFERKRIIEEKIILKTPNIRCSNKNSDETPYCVVIDIKSHAEIWVNALKDYQIPIANITYLDENKYTASVVFDTLNNDIDIEIVNDTVIINKISYLDHIADKELPKDINIEKLTRRNRKRNENDK